MKLVVVLRNLLFSQFQIFMHHFPKFNGPWTSLKNNWKNPVPVSHLICDGGNDLKQTNPVLG